MEEKTLASKRLGGVVRKEAVDWDEARAGRSRGPLPKRVREGGQLVSQPGAPGRPAIMPPYPVPPAAMARTAMAMALVALDGGTPLQRTQAIDVLKRCLPDMLPMDCVRLGLRYFPDLA